MKKSGSKSRRLDKDVRNLRDQMEELSDNVDHVSSAMEENRELLYDIKEILEDKLITGVPTSPEDVLRIWNRRYPFKEDRRTLPTIIAAWSEEHKLRTLVSQAPPHVRERFIRLVRTDAAPADIQHAVGDCPPMTNDEELAFETIKSEWVAATALRTLLSEVWQLDRERFIGLLRVDPSSWSSVAD